MGEPINKIGDCSIDTKNVFFQNMLAMMPEKSIGQPFRVTVALKQKGGQELLMQTNHQDLWSFEESRVRMRKLSKGHGGGDCNMLLTRYMCITSVSGTLPS